MLPEWLIRAARCLATQAATNKWCCAYWVVTAATFRWVDCLRVLDRSTSFLLVLFQVSKVLLLLSLATSYLGNPGVVKPVIHLDFDNIHNIKEGCHTGELSMVY